MSDCDSVENKRKRQDSIKGSEVLLESPVTDVAELAEENVPVAESPAGGSSPVKRPRTSEDGDNSPAPNNAEEAKEAAESVQDKVKGISMEDAPKKPAIPVFGSAFGVTSKLGGFSSFASAAKKASPFAAFTTATSGFAKYATATPSVEESAAERDASVEDETASDSEDVAGNEDLDDDDAPAAGSKRAFEDLLTTKGKETLQLHGSLGSPVSTPMTAHGAPMTPVRTFEEDESCLLSTKAKLFELQNASWKERGGGQFKVNSKIEQPEKCRLVMRTDLTFRLILNVPLFHGLKPVCQGRFVRFTCIDVESKLPITYALRFATDAMATEAYACITKNIPEHDDDDDVQHSASEDSDNDSDEEEEEEEEVEEEGDDDKEGEEEEDQGEAKETDEEEGANVAEDEEDDEEEASQSDAESQAEQQSSANEEENEAQDDASAASASASANDDDASGQEQSEGEGEEDESE
ncbi:hypothetical protein FBU31_003200 [Coemansia sp. 'formosensis']|nr:hypothetical protein FBU31_003200 [Coemansia sp. 'formosensis']